MVQGHDTGSGNELRDSTPRALPPLGDWAALDADYRDGQLESVDGPIQLPTSGVTGRFWKMDADPPSDLRLRLERPALLLWLLLSCFWHGFIPWMVLGLALAACALGVRSAFRKYGLFVQPWLYFAMGLGQIMLAFSFITSLGPLWLFVGLYWLGVMVTWFTIGVRGMHSF